MRTKFSLLEIIINYENATGPILTFRVFSVSLVICGLNGSGGREVLGLKYVMLLSSLLSCLSVYKGTCQKTASVGLIFHKEVKITREE